MSVPTEALEAVVRRWINDSLGITLCEESLQAVRRMALNVLRAFETPNIAAALREHALKVGRLFAKLG